LGEISKACLLERTSVTTYLARLQELRFIERRLPVTLTREQQRRSKQGRYHLCDPYFRFYFRFVEPHHKSLIRTTETLVHLQQELRAFVALGFETLAQQWVMRQAQAGNLPFTPEAVGAHWSRQVQVDVVALNWHTHELLLGECKWGADSVDRAVVRELIERKGALLRQELPNGEQWRFSYVLFARAGFTEGAKAEMAAQGGFLVDLAALDACLR
jgi:AAA+ ATPase superfamily predicted ATPase